MVQNINFNKYWIILFTIFDILIVIIYFEIPLNEYDVILEFKSTTIIIFVWSNMFSIMVS